MRAPVGPPALAISIWLAWATAIGAVEPEVLQLDLPGTLQAGAATRGPSPALWLLTRSKDAETSSLHRFDLGSDRRLVLGVADISKEVQSLAAADLDGDGAPEPILLSSERWWTARGATVTLLAEGGGRWIQASSGARLAVPSPGPPAIARVGELVVVAGAEHGLHEVRTVPLPVHAESRAWGLRLSSPTMLPHPAGGWFGWQDPRGRELPVVHVPTEGNSASLSLMLPEPERLGSVHPLVLDGRPHLSVATFVSMGPMANQRIRLFPLPETSGPVDPILALELDVHVWHTIRAFAVDVDRDGDDELLLGSPEGMGGGSLRFRAYDTGQGPAAGSRPVAEAEVPLDDGDWHFGDDLDGDGELDLLIRDGAELLLYPAFDPREKLPRPRSLELTNLLGGAEPSSTETEVRLGSDASVEQRPRPGALRHQVLDLDGDEVSEIVAWREQADGRTRLVLISFSDRAGSRTPP